MTYEQIAEALGLSRHQVKRSLAEVARTPQRYR
ncbi:MAG: hypothetical protein RLZZ396_1113 [Planctomycetota bacterium]